MGGFLNLGSPEVPKKYGTLISTTHIPAFDVKIEPPTLKPSPRLKVMFALVVTTPPL